MSFYDQNFQQIAIDRRFRDDLRKTIAIIEESKSQNEFQINVGKLVGMVHFIANMTFQDELPVAPSMTFTGTAAPTFQSEERRDDISIPVRG